jgi:hypothetical protein
MIDKMSGKIAYAVRGCLLNGYKLPSVMAGFQVPTIAPDR